MAPSITVAGAGHSFIAYDRVGPRVLALLSNRYGDQIDLCEIGTTSLALLDHLRGQDLLIIVDACIFGGPAGEVRETSPDLDTVPPTETSVHQIGPMETLYVAKHLDPDILPKRTLLLLVETNGITDAIEEQACREVLTIIDRELLRYGVARRVDE